MLGVFDARTFLLHHFIRVTMLAPVIRRCVPYSLRQIAASVTYRNRTRTRVARQCSEANMLSAPSPSIAACRVYSTSSDPEPRVSLPMLVADAQVFVPSFLTPFRLFFFSFKTIPGIDKEFSISETVDGAKYAITVISKALKNEDYDSLEGLVADDMIEVLRTKIETLSPEQRWLIAVDEKDIVFHVLCDVAATEGDQEHSIEIKLMCHYIPNMAEKEQLTQKLISFKDVSELGDMLVCNYTFTRKYVNNVGGPWIATFVNHYSISMV